MQRSERWLRAVVCASVVGFVSTLGAGPAWAQESEGMEGADASASDEGPNTGNVSVNMAFDVASAYYFRGIPQVDEGVVYQPAADIGLGLYSNDDSAVSSVDLNVGTWSSLHSRNSGDPWYEHDFYVALTFGLPAGFTFSTGYTNLYNPAGGTQFSEELNFALSFDDSPFYEDTALEGLAFALSPSVNIIVESEAGSDGIADNEGGLALLGLEPSITVGDGNYPVTLSVPIEVALNLGDYYETGSGEDDDKTLGYVDIAAAGSIPLAFLPANFGEWSFSTAVHFLYVGPSAREIGENDFGVSSGDPWEVYVTGGVSMSY